MAKAAYIGVGNIAKKIKNCYIGVDNVAKKVSKAYIGIGGLARLWWSSEVPCPLVYVGRLTDLATGRAEMGRATNANYVFFAGGYNYDGDDVATVEKYNASGTRSSCTALTTACTEPAGGTIGSYAFFTSGGAGTATQAYNTSGTKKTCTALSEYRRKPYICTFNSKLTLLFGQVKSNSNAWGGKQSHKVECYNSSLTKSTPTTSLLSSQIGGTGSYYLYLPTVGMTDSTHLIAGGGEITDISTGGDNKSEKFYNMYSLSTSFATTTITSLPTDVKPTRWQHGFTLSTGCWFKGGGYDDLLLYDKNLVQTRVLNSSGVWFSFENTGPVVVADHVVGLSQYTLGSVDYESIPVVFDANGIVTYCPTEPTELADRNGSYVAQVGWGNKFYVAGGEENEEAFMKYVDIYEIVTS